MLVNETFANIWGVSTDNDIRKSNLYGGINHYIEFERHEAQFLNDSRQEFDLMDAKIRNRKKDFTNHYKSL